METWDAIRSRRNVRTYEDRPIPDEHLDQILEAGRRTPSSRNWQPWDFVVVTERARLEELANVWPQGGKHVARSAATVALVGPVPNEDFELEWLQYDLGQATMAIMLTAVDLGVGSGHSAVRDRELARKLLGLPSDKDCYYLVALGYPADRPFQPIKKPNRRPFEDVVHREHW